MQNSKMKLELAEKIKDVYGLNSEDIIDVLFKENILKESSVRNYLIRAYFDKSLKKKNTELIKNIFIDISDKYQISVRQAQRIVYDYMKTK